MALSNSLASQFAKIISQPVEQKQTETTVTGTAVEYAGKIYVQLDGSDQLTPIASSTVGMKDGDRVTVQIKNHSATATGNTTDPAASSDKVDSVVNDMQEVSDQITEFEIAIGDKVSVEELEAESARIDNLISENVTIKEQLTANSADIRDLEADNVTINEKLTAAEADIDRLDATVITADVADLKYATIESLEATNADIHNLEADYGDFKQLTTDDLAAMNASITNLDAEKLDAEQAEILYANIDFANIGDAAIENFFSKSGMIEDLVVSSGTVTGELVGVTIKGDLIEGGTVVADKLVILGDDGLYYKLNTNGETVSSEQTEYNSLSGTIITAKSITAEKISVNDLVAFGATIGGYHITDDSLYSGVKSSATNTTRGVFMNDDGEFAVGDANNFVRFFKDTDGQYKLAISASQISMGGTHSLEDAITDQVDEFYQSTSPTVLSGGSWSSTAPTWTQGKFIWRRTLVTYLSGATDYIPSETGVCISGNTGAKGDKGDDGDPGAPGSPGAPGKDGSDGKDGTSVTITSTSVTYQASTSGTTVPTGTWLTSIPSVSAGQYLWTKTVVNYSDGKSTTSYSVGRMGQNGNPGSPGKDGEDGSDGRGVQSTAITYQAGLSQTTAPTGEWQTTVPTLTTELPYLWTRTVITYTDNTTSTSYSVSSTLESFEIGGRNLYLNSSFSNGTNNWSISNAGSGSVETIDERTVLLLDASNSNAAFAYAYQDKTVDLNTYYSISSWVYSTSDVAASIYSATTDGGWDNAAYKEFNIPANTWTFINLKRLSHSSLANMIFGIGCTKASGQIYIYHPKLEKGTKPTDWTPAPEDTQDAVNNAQTVADTAQNTADAAQEAVNQANLMIDSINASIASLVTDENGSSLMTQTSDGWTFNIGSLQSDVENNANKINEVIGDMSEVNNLAQQTNDLANDIAEKTAYMTVTQDESGDPALTLGRVDSQFRIRITNTSIDFLEGTQRIAYITNRQLYIQSSVVTDEMKIGATSGYVWKKRGNNHMGLRWVGEDYQAL